VPAPGRLLVATPTIAEPTFFRTVILLLEHDDATGSLGVVLNRPSELTVADTVPEWAGSATAPGVIHAGGPVAPGSALALARLTPVTPPAAGLTVVFGAVAVVDLDTDPATVASALAELRIYNGYAGWGPAQLRGELRGGAWWVFDSQPEDWFSNDPDGLWYRVLARQGGRWTMWAHAPEDLSVN